MLGTHKQSWPTERVDKLSALLASGYSASQAAREMDCTRNSIIGIAHRKKLAFKYQPSPGRPRSAGPRNAMPRRSTPFRPKIRRLTNQGNRLEIVEANAPRCVPVARDPTEIPTPQRRTLLELNSDHCRWPYGDVGTPDFFFCGGAVAQDKPYCADHCRLAYRRPGQREEQAA